MELTHTRCAQVLCYNAETHKLLKTLTGHTGAVSAVAFDKVGECMVSVGSDNTLRLWGKHAA